jgi:hypothetical protein
MNFNVKKEVFGEKNSRTIKKSDMYLLIAREREEILHAKSILSE